jgi:hypothetical protein
MAAPCCSARPSPGRSIPCGAGTRGWARGLGRDAGKLARFGEFTAAIRTGQAPSVPHLAIDNRLGAEPLSRQLEVIIPQVAP